MAWRKPTDLKTDELLLLKRLLEQDVVHRLMGADEWDLTEDEEMRLWNVIRIFQAWRP